MSEQVKSPVLYAQALVWRTRSVAITWSAPDAKEVSTWIEFDGEVRDEPLVEDSKATGPTVTGSRAVLLPDTGRYRLRLQATYEGGTTQEATMSLECVDRNTFVLVILATLLALLMALFTLLLLVVLPDQTERTGIGTIAKAASWVTGALGALTLLPLLSERIFKGESRLVAIARLLPIRDGYPTVLYVALCVLLFGIATFIVSSSKYVIVMNETERDVDFTEGDSVAYAFPKGVALIRPRTSTLALLRGPDGGATYYPSQVVPESSKDGDVLHLRCVESLSVVAPLSKVTSLHTQDATVRGNVTLLAGDRSCGTTNCARYVFELIDKTCAADPLRSASQVHLHIGTTDWTLDADLRGGNTPFDDDILHSEVVIVERALRVPWPDNVKLSARAAGLSFEGTCHAGICRLPSAAAYRDLELAWAIPASEDAVIRSVGDDPDWAIRFERSLADLATCETMTMVAMPATELDRNLVTDAGADAGLLVEPPLLVDGVEADAGMDVANTVDAATPPPSTSTACPLRAQRVTVDDGLVKTNGSVVVRPQLPRGRWSSARVLKDPTFVYVLEPHAADLVLTANDAAGASLITTTTSTDASITLHDSVREVRLKPVHADRLRTPDPTIRSLSTTTLLGNQWKTTKTGAVFSASVSQNWPRGAPLPITCFTDTNYKENQTCGTVFLDSSEDPIPVVCHACPFSQ